MKPAQKRNIPTLLFCGKEAQHLNISEHSTDISSREMTKISTYLYGNTIIAASPGIEYCVACNEVAGSGSWSTDGEWEWSDCLFHYISSHDLEMPECFRRKIINSN